MALLMEAIVTARGIGAAERAYGMELLEGQLTRGGIPAGLPAEVTSGNKTGTWDNATHDVAYVDAPGGMYVIVVFTDQGWAWDPIARVSAAVYAYLAR
jgi:beta-lactamase class A